MLEVHRCQIWIRNRMGNFLIDPGNALFHQRKITTLNMKNWFACSLPKQLSHHTQGHSVVSHYQLFTTIRKFLCYVEPASHNQCVTANKGSITRTQAVDVRGSQAQDLGNFWKRAISWSLAKQQVTTWILGQPKMYPLIGGAMICQRIDLSLIKSKIPLHIVLFLILVQKEVNNKVSGTFSFPDMNSSPLCLQQLSLRPHNATVCSYMRSKIPFLWGCKVTSVCHFLKFHNHQYYWLCFDENIPNIFPKIKIFFPIIIWWSPYKTKHQNM